MQLNSKIELSSTDKQLIHSEIYRARPKVSEFRKSKFAMIPGLEVIEPAQSEWTIAFFSASEKYGLPRFCVDYKSRNTLTLRDYCLTPWMYKCIEALGDVTMFQLWMSPARSEMSKLPE